MYIGNYYYYLSNMLNKIEFCHENRQLIFSEIFTLLHLSDRISTLHKR